MSSAHISPPKAPLPLTDLCREEAPLETVQDSEETLAVSIERCLLDGVSIDISPACPVSSFLWSKWLYITQATCSTVKVVSLSKESSPWDVAYMGAFP